MKHFRPMYFDHSIELYSRDFPDEEDRILGAVNADAKSYQGNGSGFISKDGQKLDVYPALNGKILGYLPYQDGFAAVVKPTGSHMPFLVMAFAAVLLTAVFWNASAGTRSTDQSEDTPMYEGLPYQGILNNGKPESETQEDVNMIIPGYDTVYVCPDQKVDLLNPAGNPVDFKYTILEDGKVIHETQYVKPGDCAKWEAWKDLDCRKDTDITMHISTIDPDTMQPCNGADLNVEAVGTEKK